MEAANSSQFELLLELIHRVSGELKKTEFGQPDTSLFVAARGILQSLAEGGPQTVPDLARTRNSSRQNVQIIVNRLRRIQCIEFVSNPAHKRSDLVQLTPKGRQALTQSKTDAGEIVNRLAPSFSEAEIGEFTAFLERLRSAIKGDKVEDSKSPTSPSARPKRIKPVQPQDTQPTPDPQPVPENISEPVEEAVDDNQLPYNLL